MQLVQQLFEIFLGDAKFLPLKALYQGTFAPYDFTNTQEIEVMLPLSGSGGFQSLFLTDGDVVIVGQPNLGTFGANISSVISPTLQPGTLQDVFAIITTTSGTPINISGGLAVETVYCITDVGNTTPLEWQALGLATTVAPAVGVTFTCTSATPGVGTGVVQTLAQNSPFTTPFRKCFSVFE